jgi:NitT/TauT family transport system permease protein
VTAAATGRGGSEAWLRISSFAVLALVWAAVSAVAGSRTLPTPWAVAAAAWDHAFHGDLPISIAITLGRVAAAFVLAMLVGTAIGIAMGRNRIADRVLDGWLVIGLNVPALVTIILCYVWFGLNDWAAILAVALNKVPTVVAIVREGARAVDPDLMAVARVFRLPPLRTLFRVYLPQLYPHLMAAVRSGLSLIWKIVLVVELLGRPNGIGFQLRTFFTYYDITGIFAYTGVFVAVILVIEAAIMRPLDRRAARWRDA